MCSRTIRPSRRWTISAIERPPCAGQARRRPEEPAAVSHTPLDRQQVIAALDGVIDPKSGRGLHVAGLVQGLTVGEDRAGFVLEVPPSETAVYAPVRDAAEAALKALPGMNRVSVVLTAEAV